MSKSMACLWDIEPHTLAKHEILKRYLEAWFPILAKYNQRVVYLDGFCGPGRYKGGEDGSPIIAIKQALNHSESLREREAVFIFVDEREDRVKHLEGEIASMAIPLNFSIYVELNQFEDTMHQILEDLKSKNLNLAPTFAFIDPFGFKGVPYSLIQQLLSNRKTEVFINVMAEFINRFVEHPDTGTKQHIIDLFGTDQAPAIISRSGDRLDALRQLYQSQLQKCAQFVRYFEMRDNQDRLIYYLFFATNHPLGHVRMKEAFWKVDPESGFHFSDATNPEQLILLSLDPSRDLASMLKKQFQGKRTSVRYVRQYVENDTAYIAKQMRKALALLEAENLAQVEELKVSGAKRRRGTFCDDVTIRFS